MFISQRDKGIFILNQSISINFIIDKKIAYMYLKIYSTVWFVYKKLRSTFVTKMSGQMHDVLFQDSSILGFFDDH